MDARAEAFVETQENGGIEVTQRGTLPAGDDRRHPPRVLGEWRVSDRVHAGIEAVKVPADRPPPDRAVAHPDREELAAAHHPMLPRRNPRQPHLRVCAENWAPPACFFLHTPRVPGWVLREGCECYG
jgi:hypothetical protein